MAIGDAVSPENVGIQTTCAIIVQFNPSIDPLLHTYVPPKTIPSAFPIPAGIGVVSSGGEAIHCTAWDKRVIATVYGVNNIPRSGLQILSDPASITQIAYFEGTISNRVTAAWWSYDTLYEAFVAGTVQTALLGFVTDYPDSCRVLNQATVREYHAVDAYAFAYSYYPTDVFFAPGPNLGRTNLLPGFPWPNDVAGKPAVHLSMTETSCVLSSATLEPHRDLAVFTPLGSPGTFTYHISGIGTTGTEDWSQAGPPTQVFDCLIPFEVPSVVQIGVKVWNEDGQKQWKMHPAKVWDGTNWVWRTVRVFDLNNWTRHG